jgi:hypothetical protein
MARRFVDLTNNVNLDQAAQATMAIADALQKFPVGAQLPAAAAFFLTLAEHRGWSAQDAFTVTKNVMNDAQGRPVPEFRAVMQYIKEELP